MSYNGWKEVKLGELLNFRRGHDLPKTKMHDGNIPVVGSNGVIGFHNEMTTKAPCLTVGRSGNIGNPCYINKDCWAHNTSLYVDDFKGNDAKYIYYLLRTLNLAFYGGGSAVPTLNRNHIHPIEVMATENIEEQKAIAATLSCLDDKIELNNRINKNLEEMAQAIFKSWFVDFEPFQDGEFEDSELGRIPNGWRVGTIEEIADICIGGDWGKERHESGLKPVICLRGTDLQSLKESGFSSKAPIRWVTSDSIIKREITDRDILIGGSGLGPIGRSLYCCDALNELYDYPVIYSNFCKKIRARDHQTAIYLETVIEYLYIQGGLLSYMNGTSIPNLDMNSLMKRELLIPSDEAIMSFADFKQLFFQRKFSDENQELSSLRDTLLPKLMSGEIRVPIEGVI